MVVHREAAGSVVVVNVTGELDVPAAQVLKAQLREERQAGTHFVVLNAERITGAHWVGLGMLVEEAREFRMHDGSMVLAGLPVRARHLCQALGADRLLRLFDNATEAVAALSSAPLHVRA